MSYLGRSAKLSLKAQEKVSFLATAGQTVKTGLSYTPSFVELYVNGVLLTDTTDFTATNGNSVTFTVALLLNDEVTVISLKTFTVADHYTKSDADTLLAAKATVANFTSTGIDDNATSTAITIDASENVGINTTSPAGTVHIKNTHGYATSATTSYSNAALRLDTLNTGTSVGLSAGCIGPNIQYIQGSYNEGTTTPIALNPYGGAVTIGSGVTLGNGNTYAAANTLDDYEEGTFVATLRGTVNDPSTAVTTTSMYRKIGETVYIQIAFENWNTAGASGQIQVTGLPFTSSPTGRFLISNSFYEGASWPSSGIPTAYVEANGTKIVCFTIRSSAAWTDTSHNASPSGNYFWFAGTYPTGA